MSNLVAGLVEVKLSDLKAGDKFFAKVDSFSGDERLDECTLISYLGMDKYMVDWLGDTVSLNNNFSCYLKK